MHDTTIQRLVRQPLSFEKTNAAYSVPFTSDVFVFAPGSKMVPLSVSWSVAWAILSALHYPRCTLPKLLCLWKAPRYRCCRSELAGEA